MSSTNFHQLHIFHTVARLGSFTKAAEELNISQPAVSIQVRELERNLDTTLLHRMRRGIQLTETGDSVFGYARRIFALADEMQASVQDIQGLRTGRLTIGSSTTPGEYILPWVMGIFQQRYPGVDVSLTIGNTRSVVERILNRELDMGMAGAAVDIKGLVSFTYVNDEIVMICSPNHAVGQVHSPRLSDLVNERFIMREPGSATREAAEEQFKALGMNIKVVMELGSNEAVKRAVAAGLGLGLVSRFSVGPDVVAGFIKIMTVHEWKCERPLTVFYRDDAHMPNLQKAFLGPLQNESPL
ncbi:MAG: LysR family transcriptional regulator, partial [Chloroflexi bacterium]|nr:LysR family transcriptional regulator [Chloroflexota bacterium]